VHPATHLSMRASTASEIASSAASSMPPRATVSTPSSTALPMLSMPTQAAVLRTRPVASAQALTV
jgi:hypothetical protein